MLRNKPDWGTVGKQRQLPIRRGEQHSGDLPWFGWTSLSTIAERKRARKVEGSGVFFGFCVRRTAHGTPCCASF